MRLFANVRGLESRNAEKIFGRQRSKDRFAHRFYFPTSQNNMSVALVTSIVFNDAWYVRCFDIIIIINMIHSITHAILTTKSYSGLWVIIIYHLIWHCILQRYLSRTSLSFANILIAKLLVTSYYHHRYLV